MRQRSFVLGLLAVLVLGLAGQASAQGLPQHGPPTSPPYDGPTVADPGPSVAVSRLPAPAPEAHTPAVEQVAADAAPPFSEQVTNIDPALLSAGETAFTRSCTQCHDAQRSLAKNKDLAGWRAIVRRMADKNGAEIAPQDRESIAIYLALKCGAPTSQGCGLNGLLCVTEERPLSLYATLSPQWRGGAHDVQNQGFFPDVWVGAEWHTASPLSARVTSCVSCHTEPGEGSRIEFAEAVLRLDVAQLVSGCTRRAPAVQSSIEAGRLVVPFGAFAAQSNPGIYRTVTKPLIYNMGQRVFDEDLGEPVLPMPYSDEGATFNLGLPLVGNLDATLDLYAVNGLQGGEDGVDLDLSREYVDNNTEPALGARATVGNPYLRFGGSVMSGRFNAKEEASPSDEAMRYTVWGADVVARYEDLVRVQFEYAHRDSDRLQETPVELKFTEAVKGYYIEGEVRAWSKPRISLLMRYDAQDRDSLLPPGESSLATGKFSVSRITAGVNFTLPDGSLLMADYEHWFMPTGLDDADVFGVRWAATF